ncbi:RrF2 family transcriptional regulator [Polaribacter glomeratus]|uniref:Transcriptional regulator n=1 Tax=Polaribacter glomeratus TaxID=102 RepID=A0A2S7WGK0_9FLAO|nr:Rrf2 family transcriptional regulator [Polaribacter glomeratus]PQJ76738.1 transcriptional regulator [Polaribacter glomeratus]TXD67420.1 Rrf2 family transcriptional regulator [Polaribacter glomeratus]
MFSKTCEYGLRAVIFIALESNVDKKVSITAIADAIESPQAFTAKILQQLTKNKIVQSIKGPNGGFFIDDKSLKTVALSNIVAVLDGDAIYTGCGLGLHQCNDKKPCPLHFKFVEIRENLKKMLESTTLFELATDMNLKEYFLKN